MKEIFSKNIQNVISGEDWLIRQDEYAPDRNIFLETIFTLANGYMGTRGALEEGSTEEHPGTFISGLFNRSEALNKKLLNVQNWLGIKIYVQEKLLSPDTCEIVSFHRILDMKKGLLARRMVVRNKEGRETLVEGLRFISRSNLHRAAVKLYVTPINYSGRISVEGILDGTTVNMKESPRRRVKHTRMIENSSLSGGGCYLEMAARDTDQRIAMGSALKVLRSPGRENAAKFEKFAAYGEQSVEFRDINAFQGSTIKIEKYVITYTSRDVAKDRLKETIEKELQQFVMQGWSEELQRHIKIYQRLWDISDIEILGDVEANKALRFNIFHLMSFANPVDDKVSIGANGLHGERYAGLTFWDTEIFMLPFYIYTNPEAAKTLLQYRYNLLDVAKEIAAKNAYKGAQYPWQCADDGTDQTRVMVVGANGDLVKNVECWRQYHITADIAYAVVHYVRATGDIQYLFDFGSRIILETARFWASLCIWNPEKERYEIKNVIGPDEYHEHVDNNCFTNRMAKWNIQNALDILKSFEQDHPKVYEKLLAVTGICADEINELKKVCEKIYILYDDNTKLMEQFEGYFNKEDFTISEYNDNNMPVIPKGAEGKDMKETQLLKQADVVMLTYLLEDVFDEETKKLNFDYYEKRTTQESSLSPSIYALMGLKTGNAQKSYEYFLRTAQVDLANLNGNTEVGLHAAAAGGTWQVAVMGFAGMKLVQNGELVFKPRLPEHWKGMRFSVFYRGSLLRVMIEGEKVTIERQ